MIRNTHIASFLIATLLLAFSCKNNVDNPCANDYDQSVLFRAVSGQVSAAYSSLNTSLEAVSNAKEVFFSNPNEESLSLLRQDFRESYLAWQRAEPFEFGPAEELQLIPKMNNFPVNVSLLEANIASGIYDINAPDNYYSGFPAMDYLLNGIGTSNTEIIDKLTNSNLFYGSYLNDVLATMRELSSEAATRWANYENNFEGNTGTAAGSSLSLIVNALNQHYERIKRDRIGIPSGQLTLGQTFPEKSEGYYGGLSTELLTESLQSSKAFFQSGANDGLDDYLDFINAQKDGQSLSQTILNQYDAALSAVNSLSSPLPDAVDNHPVEVQNAYATASAQVVNIKTDMPSLLCISITYIDNPSDSD